MSWSISVADRRVTVVTGAGRGIGRVLAVAFGAKGDAVVLASRNVTNLEAAAVEVEAAGGEPFVVATDVTDEAGVAGLGRAVLDRYGRVDVLVNNSGVGGPSSVLWETDPAEWRAVLDVNVIGAFLMCRALMPTMIRQRSGSVIVIGSVSGMRPLFGRSAYAASKVALIGLTRALALEAGSHGVRVNMISPGFVAGPRIDWAIAAQAAARGIGDDQVRGEFESQAALKRLTEASDVAEAAVFLASDAARGITGVDLSVTSGITY
jgi:NAD(P)-dependent dehydrogenase (short-subunit alcohol dehydrogenase family)